MRVYVGDHNTGVAQVSVVERSSASEVGEIADLLGDLRWLQDEIGLDAEISARREAEFLGRKARVMTRIDQAEAARVARPLPDWSPPVFSVAWGDGGSGSLVLAECLLRDCFDEWPSRELAVRFRDEVIAQFPRDGFALGADEIIAWHQASLEQAAPADALAVPPSPAGGPAAAANASALVAACEEAWAAIQARHPDVPDAVIVLGTGVERGRLVKLGHWWGGRWLADGSVRGEVLLAGEALHLPAAEVFEVLLHEAAHGLNAARGIKDASRGGRYHNQRFRMTAAALGLRVDQARPYGWAKTTLTLAAAEDYAAEIASLGRAMRITRQLEAGVRLGEDQDRAGEGLDAGAGDAPGQGGRTRNGVGAACGCERRMRIAPAVLARGPVLCGLCGAEFTTGRSLERSQGRAELAVVDDSFVERRQRALSAQTAAVGPDAPSPLGSPATGSSPAALAIAGSLLADVMEQGMLESWRQAWDSADEILLSGRSPAEVARLNNLARDCLQRDGTIHGPSAVIAGREFAAGERVVVGTDGVAWPGGGHPVPEGVVGVVEAVGPDWLDIDFAITGRARFPTAQLGSKSLGYGYAVHEADVLDGLDLSALRLAPARAGAAVEAEIELPAAVEVEP